ncbi:MAG: type I methionyl aminopeptidase [Pirellulales bacterium]
MLTLRSPRELAALRRAGLVVWRAHQEVAREVRPGVTTAELDAIVESVFARYGAEPLFKGVPGKIPFPAATCISVNEAVVHGIPGDRRLRAGDIVSVDTGCRFEGWCGDSAWTHPVDSVAPRVQELLDVTRQTLELAIRLLGEKSRWSEVATEMAQLVRSHGLAVVEAFSGHGIGREMHEEPQAPNYCSAELKRRDFLLKPGLVLAIEPMVNLGTKQVRCLRDHWTQVTCDGQPSAHFEHTIAVTAQGPWVLTGPPVTPEEEEFCRR